MLLYSYIITSSALYLTFTIQQLLVGPLFTDPSVLDDDDLIASGQVGDAVGDEQPGFAPQLTVGADDLVEDVLAHVGVDGREWVV